MSIKIEVNSKMKLQKCNIQKIHGRNIPDDSSRDHIPEIKHKIITGSNIPEERLRSKTSKNKTQKEYRKKYTRRKSNVPKIQ